MRRTVFLLLILSIVFGCAKQNISPMVQSSSKLDRDMPVYVAIGEDGKYGSFNYYGTGREVSILIMNSINQHAHNVELADEYLKKADALEASAKNGCSYMVMPTFVHFEDRNTPWSGRRDHVTLQIDIYDTGTKEKINSTTIAASNRWFQFRDHSPMVLLRRPIKTYIDSVY